MEVKYYCIRCGIRYEKENVKATFSEYSPIYTGSYCSHECYNNDVLDIIESSKRTDNNDK